MRFATRIILAFLLPAVVLAEDVPAAKTGVFVGADAGGNWTALETWKSQDGAAPKRIPGDGDTVTINGSVTVDAAVTVGTGAGDAIVVSKGSKLVVSAALTVKGSIKCAGQPEIEVQPGGGIELDGAAGVTPTIHAEYGSALHLYFRGAEAKRCFLRTKPGTAGNPGEVIGGNSVPLNVGATCADFSDLGSKTAFGLNVAPSKDARMAALDRCTFTRANIKVVANAGEFTLSDCIFTDTTLYKLGDLNIGAHLSSNANLLSVVGCSFDKLVWPDRLKEVRSTVFYGNFYFNPYTAPAFLDWSENLAVVLEPSSGFVKTRPGTHLRSYWICPVPDANNPHILAAAGTTVFDQCIWDVPLSVFVDDAILLIGREQKDVTVRRCLSLPRMAGKRPGCGVSLGFVGAPDVRYQHNVIFLGVSAGINSDVQHGGVPGSIVDFRNNILCMLDSVPNETGHVFGTDFKDLVSAAACDFNTLWRSDYGKLSLTEGKPGAHDVAADPKFVDPARNLVTFYRRSPGVRADTAEKDLVAALDWIRRNPRKMGELIDWVFAGFVPTNPSLKAASDPDGPTKGWIGAMEGAAAAPK